MTDEIGAGFEQALAAIVDDLVARAGRGARRGVGTGRAAVRAAFSLQDLKIGVAVSGGGDSMALLHLLCQAGFRPQVASVDHNLRPESADEAAWVGAQCASLGLDHEILRWEGWDGEGNLQDAARRARQRLLAGWAKARGIGIVALGHTADDQAETVLMRLVRGSGVDGLSGMAPSSIVEDIVWIRPLLGLRREALRHWLVAREVAWLDDPGNTDARFERVRMRNLLPALAEAGLTVERLADTAAAMGRARQALEAETLTLAREVAEPSDLGYVALHQAGLAAAPEEVALRLLAHSMAWVSGADYRPRLAPLSAILEQGQGTLGGCLIRTKGGHLQVFREPARTDPAMPAGTLWDGRWETHGPEGVTVRALGEEGLAHWPPGEKSSKPREALLSTPAFWRDGEPVASPFLAPDPSCRANLRNGISTYFSRIIRR